MIYSMKREESTLNLLPDMNIDLESQSLSGSDSSASTSPSKKPKVAGEKRKQFKEVCYILAPYLVWIPGVFAPMYHWNLSLFGGLYPIADDTFSTNKTAEELWANDLQYAALSVWAYCIGIPFIKVCVSLYCVKYPEYKTERCCRWMALFVKYTFNDAILASVILGPILGLGATAEILPGMFFYLAYCFTCEIQCLIDYYHKRTTLPEQKQASKVLNILLFAGFLFCLFRGVFEDFVFCYLVRDSEKLKSVAEWVTIPEMKSTTSFYDSLFITVDAGAWYLVVVLLLFGIFVPMLEMTWILKRSFSVNSSSSRKILRHPYWLRYVNMLDQIWGTTIVLALCTRDVCIGIEACVGVWWILAAVFMQLAIRKLNFSE
jgi:hypothetical protein